MPISLLPEKIFNISDEQAFVSTTLEVFRFQYKYNAVYRSWCQALGCLPHEVFAIEQIPFLPISFFKSHRVVSFQGAPEIGFISSGTTGSIHSRHFVASSQLYKQSFLQGFRLFYGDPADYCILALLPGYLERKESSLVYMVQHLIALSNNEKSGFYLDQMHALQKVLLNLMEAGQKVLLIGVSFALLDLAERYPMPLSSAIIMETGGMKGRRKELVREELHNILGKAFGQQTIHSEYGMTELLSQAYSSGRGIFNCPPWMRVLLRDSNDPLSHGQGNRTGGINVIDLANLWSCSFIATQDLGRIHPDSGFEVLGRFDNSDTRGCNLMIGGLEV